MERSNRERFRQFEEQSRKDEVLTKEKRVLRQKNRALENRVAALEIHFDATGINTAGYIKSRFHHLKTASDMIPQVFVKAMGVCSTYDVYQKDTAKQFYAFFVLPVSNRVP